MPKRERDIQKRLIWGSDRTWTLFSMSLTPSKWRSVRGTLKCLQSCSDSRRNKKSRKRVRASWHQWGEIRKWPWLAVLALAAAMETAWQSRLTLQRHCYMCMRKLSTYRLHTHIDSIHISILPSYFYLSALLRHRSILIETHVWIICVCCVRV